MIGKLYDDGGKYPINTLEVGEAFKLPYDDKYRVRAACAYIRGLTGKKFSVRTLDRHTAVCKRLS